MVPDAKALKKLAKICREAGIKHYKCVDFEFTLTDELPEPRLSAKVIEAAAAASNSSGDGPAFRSDSLTPSELLFWSTRNVEESFINSGETDK